MPTCARGLRSHDWYDLDALIYQTTELKGICGEQYNTTCLLNKKSRPAYLSISTFATEEDVAIQVLFCRRRRNRLFPFFPRGRRRGGRRRNYYCFHLTYIGWWWWRRRRGRSGRRSYYCFHLIYIGWRRRRSSSSGRTQSPPNNNNCDKTTATTTCTSRTTSKTQGEAVEHETRTMLTVRAGHWSTFETAVSQTAVYCRH